MQSVESQAQAVHEILASDQVEIKRCPLMMLNFTSGHTHANKSTTVGNKGSDILSQNNGLGAR